MAKTALQSNNKQTAKLSFLRVAPRKVRLVAHSIKGMSVNEAEARLMVRPQRAAKPLLKLLRSAVANAKNGKKLNIEKLFVETITVDKGPMLKRYLPRARGSASPIHKVMSHVTLTLAESDKESKNKFKIAPTKKTKLPPEAKAKKKQKKEDAANESAEKPKSGGSLKRIFNRKAI